MFSRIILKCKSLVKKSAAILKTVKEPSSKTKWINSQLEDVGFLYHPGQDIFYSTKNNWQRKFGYCQLYDEAATPLGIIFDCEPIYFEFHGKKWLIELWKGQYGIATGAEIGVYNTKAPDLNIPGIFNGTFYECAKDPDCLPIRYSLKKNGKTIFTRKDTHWWLSGFKLGEFSSPSELSMDIAITLKNKDMCTAFIRALRKTGYKASEYKVRKNTLSFIFSVPHSSQPFTRTPLAEQLMQQSNQNLCKLYHSITKDYSTTLDKLAYLYTTFPRMYLKIIKLGRTKDCYQKYNELKE